MNDQRKLRTRYLMKINNRSIVLKCILLLNIKGITLNLIKVKGHSNDRWNDKVDELAKEETIQRNFIFNHDHKEAGPISFRPKIRGIITEKGIRKELKRLNDITNQIEWSFINTIRRKIEDNADWEVTWNLFRRMKGVRCNNMGTSATWTWCFKSMHDLLPTTKWLKLRRPEVYNKAQCPFCGKEEESKAHFTECTNLQEEWSSIQNELNDRVQNIMNKYRKKSKMSAQNAKEIQKRILNPLFDKSLPKNHRKQWISCIIDDRFDSGIKHIITSRTTRITLLTDILEEFISLFKASIWKPRCTKFIEWEKANGITAKAKKNSAKKKTQKRKLPNTTAPLTEEEEEIRNFEKEVKERNQKKGYTEKERATIAFNKLTTEYPLLTCHNQKESWIHIRKPRTKTKEDESELNEQRETQVFETTETRAPRGTEL